MTHNNLQFTAKLQFTSVKSCFVSISPEFVDHFAENDCTKFVVRLSTDERNVALAWNGKFAQRSQTIEISSVFGQHLGFEHGEEILVNVRCERVPDCDVCVVEPFVDSDWELIANNAQEIELNLLNQLSLVADGFSFPFWVNNANIRLFVKVTEIKPVKSLVRLVQNTELVIKPPQMASNAPNYNTDSKCESNANVESNKNSVVTSLFTKFASIFTSDEKSADCEAESKSSIQSKNIECEKLDSISESSRLIPLRVLPFEDYSDSEVELCNTVFLNPYEFEFDSKQFGIAKLVRILSPAEMFAKENKNNSHKNEVEQKSESIGFEEELFLSTHVLIRSTSKCGKGCILVCDNLRRQMRLFINSRVFIEKSLHEEVKSFDPSVIDFISIKNKQKVLLLQSLVLTPISVSQIREEDVKKYLLNYCKSHTYIVITKGTLLRINNCDYLVSNNMNNELCFIFTSHSDISEIEVLIEPPQFKKVNVSYGCELPYSNVYEVDSSSKNIFTATLTNLGGMDSTISQISTFVRINLGMGPLAVYCKNHSSKTNALLLCGPKGSGKTVLLDFIGKKFADFPHYVTVRKIECKALRGKRVDSLQKHLLKEIFESIYRQPSLIIVEDLDIVASAASKPEESEIEALYTLRVALLFIGLIKLLERVRSVFGNQFVIIASCKSKELLHPVLLQSRGRHVFEEIIELLPLTSAQREDVLKVIIKNKQLTSEDCIDSINFKNISRKCEGYLPVDLNLVVDRALHNCALRSDLVGNKLRLKDEDFDAAFIDFVPTSLKGVQLDLKTTKRWKDVGGLFSVKKILLQTILWPLKHPQLFAKCPLRPQSSILLFGAPGTGKTLLAEALANECNVNFISVKGPELLSKYIGASEQAVRNLFKRAESAKPCILFFDEFDAIAPRRGHDSTGVTDRVVNQILTQMDGVEALAKGVYILAATSRPDLLDPALLRPGRFDKCLYCPIPDKSERQQILNVLSEKLVFESDVKLEVIAEKTNNFTGADLQALLYSSQLEAFQQAQKNKPQSEFENNTNCKTGVKEIFHVMNSVEQGFNRCLSSSEKVELSKEVDVIISNQKNIVQIEADTTGASKSRAAIAIGERHLTTALRNMKPSVSDKERARYLA
ncbi:Peroxisome biogenesis factor 1-like protein, partial [Dinothrombium tinctorium]